jgi:hypothetical protein
MTRPAIALLLGCITILPGAAFGGGEEEYTTDSAVTNHQLLKTLMGCNSCEKEKAAFLLGCRKCPGAVIPLMSMLHEGEEETSRIVAALSLCLLGDGRGTFAVKRAALYDESARVRMLCAWYYNQYVREGTFLISRRVEESRTIALRSN